jgi:beta-hydroxylase
MLGELVAPRFLLLYVYVASAAYVHLRGRVRHRLQRQLTDHSTVFAPLNVLIYAASAVPRSPLLDPRAFPETAFLREHWQEMRAEAEALLARGDVRPSESHQDVAFNTFFARGWRRFHLKWYDDFLPSAEALCPRTVALLRSVPTVHAALFALLPAGGKLTEHRDPYAGSLRYHLGLITPNSDACRIFVDGQPYAWRDGEDVVFDETFIHRAENQTDQDRIILFCDLERPLRTPVMRGLNRFIAGYVLRVTASRNVPSERIGLVNQISGGVHRLRQVLRRAKRKNRRLYYTVKYALWAVVLYAVFVRVLIDAR